MKQHLLRIFLLALSSLLLAPTLVARPQTSLIRTDPPAGWEGFLMRTTVETGFIPAGRSLADPATPRSSTTNDNTAWVNPEWTYPPTADIGVPTVNSTHNPDLGAAKDTATATVDFFYRLQENAADEWGFDIDTTTSAVNAMVNFGSGLEPADAFVKVTLEMTSDGPYLVPDAYLATPSLPALTDPTQQELIAFMTIGHPSGPCPTGAESSIISAAFGYEVPPSTGQVVPFRLCPSYPDPLGGNPSPPDQFRYELNYTVVTPHGVDPPFTLGGVGFGLFTSPLVVTNTNDAGPGSLRQALADAVSGDFITFAPYLAGQTIDLISGELLITGKRVMIDATALPTPVTVDGGGSSRILHVDPTGEATVHGLVFQDGATSGPGLLDDVGGAVLNEGILSLLSCGIADSGGGATHGGGIGNSGGTLSMSHCEVTRNFASQVGGGIFNNDGGKINISDCEIHNNEAVDGGGGFQNQHNTSTPATTEAFLVNCSLHDNSARWGAGVLFGATTGTMINCTIAQNGGELGSAIYHSAGTLELRHCTVTRNTTERGAAVVSPLGTPIGTPATLTVFSSILSDNTPNDIDMASTVISEGYNLVGTGPSLGDFTATGDQTGITDPKLSPLAKYFSFTSVLVPLDGSPVVDAGGTDRATLPTDQRGLPRIADGDRNGLPFIDIGAVETTTPTLIVTNTNDGGGGSLRQVVGDVPDHGLVLFAPQLAGDITILTSGEIAITGKTVTINADAIKTGPFDRFQVNSQDNSRIFRIDASATASISSLILLGGRAPAIDPRGGGILNEGELFLADCTFWSCTTPTGSGSAGGALRNDTGAILNATRCAFNDCSSAGKGGGLNNLGTATLTGCTFAKNRTDIDGGGLYNGSVLTADRCKFAFNLAVNDGGGVSTEGTSTLTNCSVYGNRADSLGGGISNTWGSLDLEQCTIFGNSSLGVGGGLRTGYGGFTSLRHCTVTRNSAEGKSGSGIAALLLGATIQCYSSIISGNRHNADTYNSPAAGVILSDGHNLVGGGTALAIFSAPGDQPGITDPFLGPLGENGGGVASLYPLPGSPVVDAGATDASSPTMDQRGEARSADGDANAVIVADIGAVEAAAPNVLVVNNTNDAGAGSLRQAILEAELRGSQITFANALNGGTISLSTGPLALENRSLLIDAESLTNGISIDAGGTLAVVTLDENSSATLRNLTITGSGGGSPVGGVHSNGGLQLLSCTVAGNSGFTGGIFVGGPSLHVNDCQFLENTNATSLGGGIQSSQAILHLEDSTFSGNSAGDGGGGLFYRAGSLNGYTGFVERCLFTGNQGLRGSGLFTVSPLEVHACTFTGNHATQKGGATLSGALENSPVIFDHCTFEANSASVGGGALSHRIGPLLSRFNTISGNSAPLLSGGGFLVDGSGPNPATADLLSTIVSGNLGDDVREGGASTITSSGHNLIGFGNALGAFGSSGDQTGIANPRLAPLADYGGATPTMHPLPGSPVIDSGGFAALNPIPASDQRGFAREIDGDASGGVQVDIGAVEFAPLVLNTVTVTNLSDFGAGSLRDAIDNSLPGTLIDFDSSLSGGVIPSTGNISINTPFLKIDASALSNGLTLDGRYIAHLLEVKGSGVVDLCGLTLEHGVSYDCGGGIRNEGVLTLNECTVQNCLSFKDGGGICNQGGRLVLRNSTLARNFAKDFNNPGTGRGAALYNDSELSFNTVTIDHCTIANCSSGEFGGGVFNYLGRLDLRHSTITGNSADSAGSGVATFGDLSTETHVFSSIIAGNTGANDVDFVLDPSNQFFSGDYNLIGTGNATGGFVMPGDTHSITNPSLSPLGKYGGRTATILPRSNSPALEGGSTDALTPSLDQRGLPRLIDLGHDGIVLPDIGAVEIGPLPFPTNVQTVTSATDFAPGSLRNILAPDIIPGTLITFDPGFDGDTIGFTGGELNVAGLFLKIDATSLSSLELNGGGASRIFSVESQTDLELCGLTLRESQAFGGAGGAIRNEGFLTVRQCSFEDNEAGEGGAIANQFGRLTLIDSTFARNIADHGGAVHHDGDLIDRFTTVDQCTFAENFANNQGGALFNLMGIMKVRHSTISENQAVDTGAGIATNGDSSVETRLFSSIVAGNTPEDLAIVLDPLDRYATDGGNVIGFTVGTTVFPGIEDQVGIGSPGLSGLGPHGGRTETMVVEFGSPARDAGGTDPDSHSTDQRGFTREFGSAPDSGAYEASGAGGYFVWAAEFIPPGDDAAFVGHADDDRNSNGVEYGIDTNPDLSDQGHSNNFAIQQEPQVEFGFRPEALDVTWIVERSTDLLSWTETYRYDGSLETPGPDISATLNVSGRRITITDGDPPAPRAFYRLGVRYTP